MAIQVRYQSIDGARDSRSYKGIEAARAFAVKMVGAHPEMGSHYAVSGDGIGKIMVSGISLAELFGQEVASDGYDEHGYPIGYESPEAEEARYYREQMEAAHPRPAPIPEGAFGVRFSYPMHCWITDAIVGSSSDVKVAASLAEAGRQWVAHYEDFPDDVDAEIVIGQGGRWEKLKWPEVAGARPVYDDEMPF